jgi:hypothetical protein
VYLISLTLRSKLNFLIQPEVTFVACVGGTASMNKSGSSHAREAFSASYSRINSELAPENGGSQSLLKADQTEKLIQHLSEITDACIKHLQ